MERGNNLLEGYDRETDLKKAWNDFVRCLLTAETIWNNRLKGVSAKEIELSGMKGSGEKAYSVSKTATFSILMSKLVDFWRGSGGLETLLVDQNLINESKKEMDNARR